MELPVKENNQHTVAILDLISELGVEFQNSSPV